jgi:YVTN family beta-propeller protein
MNPTLAVVACILCGVGLDGCVQNPTSSSPEMPVPSAKGVYIVNEGNFGRGNASLSYYDLTANHAYADVFQAVNNRALGDVAASMAISGSRGYIVVNNSQRIEVIDIATNASVGTIATGPGSSPRQMAFVDDSLALVTDLYNNAVLKVDLVSLIVLGSIPVGENPEGLVVENGHAFVANSGFGSGNTVSVIDLGSMTVTKTIAVANNPQGMVLTPGGQIDVVCGGAYGNFSDPNDDTPAMIMVIDPSSLALVDSVKIGGHVSTMAVGGDGIGYIPAETEVLRIDTRSNTLTGRFVTGTYNGVGVESVSGDVYLSDPKSYIQPGEVVVYSSMGVERTRFQVGLIPGSFAFKR